VCRVSCISTKTRGISGQEEEVSHAQVKDLPSKSAQLRSGYISTGDTHFLGSGAAGVADSRLGPQRSPRKSLRKGIARKEVHTHALLTRT